MRFHCVNDGVPEPTVRLLRQACEKRGVEYHEIQARLFDFDDEKQLHPGDMLYRPAISTIAMRVEQFLYADGVATFYREPDGIFFNAVSSPLLFQRAGLSIPRTFFCPSADRALLDSYVQRLGGYPVVMKLLGYSRGLGVMRADSAPALYSLVDFALAENKAPLLCAYVDGATHWRCTVVGERVVSAYRNKTEINDFRTYAGEDPADFTAPVTRAMDDLAVGAVRALRNEFGGVDVLEHPSGRLYLLEANFPCYFATAQEMVGVDIAGAMIEHLQAKSLRLAVA